MTLAIGFHNIPEGLAVATVLVARGVSAKSALTWCACRHRHLGCVLVQECNSNYIPPTLGAGSGRSEP